MSDYTQITNAFINLDQPTVYKLVEEAIGQNCDPREILDKGLTPGMDVIGEKMRDEEMFLPDVMMAATTMKGCIDMLKPHLKGQDNISKGTVVLGTVQGDLHDIGKNLVTLMLASNGYDTIDLGVDIAPETFINALIENNANVLCLSTLLTTTMPTMVKIMAALEEAGIRDKVTVLVGGAPVNQDFANQIGADGYAPDAASAAQLVKELFETCAA